MDSSMTDAPACTVRQGRELEKTTPKVIHLSFAGPIYTIQWGKIGWRFEMHGWCGPVVVDCNDTPKAKQPNEGSGFWKAVTAWAKQGKLINDQGVCIYHYDGKAPIEAPADKDAVTGEGDG